MTSIRIKRRRKLRKRIKKEKIKQTLNALDCFPEKEKDVSQWTWLSPNVATKPHVYVKGKVRT